MKDDTFDLKSDKLFPFQFQLFGVAISFMGLVCIVFAPWAAPFLLLTGLLILTARRGIAFDRSARNYRIYNSFLFFKKGKPEQYRQFQYLYIHAIRTSQRVNTMVTTGITVKSDEYDGYLKTDDGDRIYLLSHSDKQQLIRKLSKLAEFLELEIRE